MTHLRRRTRERKHVGQALRVLAEIQLILARGTRRRIYRSLSLLGCRAPPGRRPRRAGSAVEGRGGRPA